MFSTQVPSDSGSCDAEQGASRTTPWRQMSKASGQARNRRTLPSSRHSLPVRSQSSCPCGPSNQHCVFLSEDKSGSPRSEENNSLGHVSAPCWHATKTDQASQFDVSGVNMFQLGMSDIEAGRNNPRDSDRSIPAKLKILGHLLLDPPVERLE